jgi:hypothetical protein
MDTLSRLYLGSDPTGVQVNDDQLVVTLADGRAIAIPLQLISQLEQGELPPAEAQLLILRQPPQIDHIHVTDSALKVYLKDERLLVCPLAWFPRLLYGTPAERNHYELRGDDNVIYWPDLDEDIELAGLFEGGRSAEGEGSLRRWLLARQERVKGNVVD